MDPYRKQVRYLILKSFKRGGVHPGQYKSSTATLAIEQAPEPQKVTILLNQHLGAPAEPVVKVGDTVKVGQLIGKPGPGLSAAVHSSVSGKVTAIGPAARPTWKNGLGITIESDGLFEIAEGIKPRDPNVLTPEEIRSAICDNGIVGLGGAAFPTHIKFKIPEGKSAEVVALNGAECEPYLTCDHRLMLENTAGIVGGLKLLMKAASAPRGVIGIESNKLDAIDAFNRVLNGDPAISVISLETRYPQGEERLLIQAAVGKEVPSGGLPIDVGVIVDNVGTAFALYNSITTGMPLIQRVVTVTGGGIPYPKNLLARIGTPFSDLIAACGELSETPGKIISGGPMMGTAVHSASVPVCKGTSGILVVPRESLSTNKRRPCIKCGRCVNACPYSLLPLFLASYSNAKMFDEAQAYHILDCKECGCCSYVCPSKIDIVQAIRMGKAEIAKRRQKKA